jgi:hypothetical protein
MRPVDLEVSPLKVPKLSSNEEKTHLRISRQLFNGDQYSLFWNSEIENSKWNTAWREETTIENIDLGVSIKLAGTAGHTKDSLEGATGVLEYIHRLGFYEGGGMDNNYRIEPQIGIAVLTGKCNKDIIEVIKKKEMVKLKPIQEELQQLTEWRSKEGDRLTQNDLKWFEDREKHLQTSLQNQKEKIDQFIQNLKSNKGYIEEQ